MVEKFTLPDGSPARDFPSVEEMDETIIQRFNERVKPGDHAYCLGDVAMHKNLMDQIMPRLNGIHRLIRGNHDIFKTAAYLRWFKEIHGTRKFGTLLFSHYPIAPWSFGRWMKANVHGHVHHSLPLLYTAANPLRSTIEGNSDRLELQYINLSIEQTDYRPVSLEEINSWV
jgi:calcineurin-like phosphoesterase family protein